MCLKFCEDYFGVHIFINMFPSSWKNTLFPDGRIVTRLPIISTSRQVEISFLGMPQIAHFQVEKWKSSLPWEGGHPHYAPSGLVASLPRKDCAPQMFWLITLLTARMIGLPLASATANFFTRRPSAYFESWFEMRMSYAVYTHDRSNCEFWITQCTHGRPNFGLCIPAGEECLGTLPTKHAWSSHFLCFCTHPARGIYAEVVRRSH